MSNPFSLLSKDQEEIEDATDEIVSLMEKFKSDLDSIQEKYNNIGAYDTASREAMAIYMAKEILQIVRLD